MSMMMDGCVFCVDSWINASFLCIKVCEWIWFLILGALGFLCANIVRMHVCLWVCVYMGVSVCTRCNNNGVWCIEMTLYLCLRADMEVSWSCSLCCCCCLVVVVIDNRCVSCVVRVWICGYVCVQCAFLDLGLYVCMWAFLCWACRRRWWARGWWRRWWRRGPRCRMRAPQRCPCNGPRAGVYRICPSLLATRCEMCLAIPSFFI